MLNAYEVGRTPLYGQAVDKSGSGKRCGQHLDMLFFVRWWLIGNGKPI